MKRYFYTCPFAAAWMAKYFGMQLQDHETNKEGEVYNVTLELMLEGDDFERPLTKYYVHPDSICLLEPRVGDVIRFGDNEGHAEPYIVVDVDFAGDPEDDNIAVLDSFQPSWWNWHIVINRSIIQRNGIAFMWPESEAA